MKKLSLLFLASFTLLSVLIVESCSKKNGPAPTQPVAIGHTLYDTLGGSTLVTDPAISGAMIEKGRLAIRSVIDSTIFVIAADSRINSHFMTLLAEVTAKNFSGYTALSENLTTFVGNAAGSKDFYYLGLSMTDAHNPATNPRINGKVTSANFDAFISDVVTGATKNKVPTSIITSIGNLLQTVRSQVVQM